MAQRHSLRSQLIALGASDARADELLAAWERAAEALHIAPDASYWDKAAAWIQMIERNAERGRLDGGTNDDR